MFPVTVLRRYQRDDLDLGYRHSQFREHRLTHIDPLALNVELLGE